MTRRSLAAILVMLAAGARAQSLPLPDLHWRELGPFRGGWATMAQGIPDRPDTFYFSAAGGGLWRTENAGRTWAPLFQHGPASSIGAFAIASSDPNTIYIGTGQPEPRYDIAAGQGVFRSSDGGRTWSPLGLQNTKYIGKIWISPSDPNTVLVGALGHVFGPSPDRGLYRSTDGGRTWSQTLKIDDSTGVVDIAADPADANTLLAAAWELHQYPWQSYFTPATGPGSAIYKSTDGGATWKKLGGAGWPTRPVGRISLATARTAAGLRIYATIDAGKDRATGGLYRSDDGGAHWQRANAGEAFTSYYASRLAVAPNDPDTIYTVGQSIRRCTKAGADCTIIKGAPGGDDYHFVWINPKHPDHMITASDQGTVVSVDGGHSWSSWYNQPTVQLYHVAADNRFPYWVYAGQQDSGTIGIASRSDYGAIGFRDWHPVGGDERDYDIPDPTDPDIVYASGLGGRVTKWDAHTGQVQNIAPWPVSSYGKRPTEVKYHYLWATPLAVSRAGPPALYLGSQDLFRSTDRGKTWTILGGDLTGKDPAAKDCGGIPSRDQARRCGYGAIAVIEPSPKDPATIWVGTDDGLIQATNDSGKTWRNVTPPNVPLWAKIAGLDLSGIDTNTAYAVIDAQRLDDYAPHILRTKDAGQTWQEIVQGLPPAHFATVIRSDPARPGLLYAGNDNGVYVSLDNGDHWQSLQRNLPSTWVRDLLVHDDDLIVGTQGRGIWVLTDISPLRQLAPGTAQKAPQLFTPATAFRVHGNNNADTPMPPETPQGENPPAGAIIDYALAAPAKSVTLDIRDAAGHTIRHYTSGAPPRAPDAERYFEAGWLRPAAPLSAASGTHRFIWDLRTERPDAINFTFGIAAIWGRDTPALPLGAWAVPGQYTIRLTVDGTASEAPLAVREDPRVDVSADDLQASAALSQKIAAALARNRRAYDSQQAVLKQLDAPKPAPTTPKQDVPDVVRAIGDDLRKPPAPGELGFDGIDEILGGIETDLEAADIGPTAAQLQVASETLEKLDAAEHRWADKLAALNAALVKSGRKPIGPPGPEAPKAEPPDHGQELP